MARVGVPGARVVVIDMVDGGSRHNELERLRDPSHTAALTRERLVGLLRDADIDASVVAEREHTMDADLWLAQAHGEREPVEAALRAEAEGGAPTGLRARRSTARCRSPRPGRSPPANVNGSRRGSRRKLR